MTPSADLHAVRKQALIDLAGSGGGAGVLKLLSAEGAVIVAIALAYPAGVVDETGVALTTTEYAQIVMTGDVARARMENAIGARVADFTVGLATDDPAPDLPLPALRFYAGAFMRLTGSHISCD